MLSMLFLLAAAVAGGDAQPGQYVVHGTDPSVNRAGQLLNASQPSQALELLQTAIERHPQDPSVLLLAGLAAYRSDQVSLALGYWTRSLDLKPNGALQALYDDAKREAAADRSGSKLFGAHIALRYDGAALPGDTARSVLEMLDRNYTRISAELGCRASERIVAILQSREQYLQGEGAAEWSGGYYDGRIHVIWTGEPDSNPRIERALAHELVHACLASMPSGSNPWPVWLQEGLAQKLSGDQLAPSIREQVRELARKHEIPRLEDLGQNWFSMTRQDALMAYHLSLAAVDALCDLYAGGRLHTILANPECLTEVTVELEAELGF